MNHPNASNPPETEFPPNQVPVQRPSKISSQLNLPEEDDHDTPLRHDHRRSPTGTSGSDEEASSTQNFQSMQRNSSEGNATAAQAPESAVVGNGGSEEGRGRGGMSPALAQKRHNSTSEPMLRKACDLCTKRKRKCDGQRPCSACVEIRASSQCVYSPRLKGGRKKKVRIDDVFYKEGTGPLVDGSGRLALVPSDGGWPRTGYSMVDSSAGRFSPSGAVGLAGHVENFFLAAYLRDFNRVVRLTTESSVTEGMLEALSPIVPSRGLSQTSPIPQPESRRQAKLAVFWGVVAMGSRIMKAEDGATARFLSLMRAALRRCFDSTDKEVVQAYVLLSTLETMRGNTEAGTRYLDHAHTMHNANAMGPDGKLRQDRPEQEEALDLVFQIYDQPKGSVVLMRTCNSSDLFPPSSSCHEGEDAVAASAAAAQVGERISSSASAVDQMIAQAMSPPSESQSGSLKALKYLGTACGLSAEVFDPTVKCVTVEQYLGEMDSALKGADRVLRRTDLSECITGVVMVKIFGGVTLVLQSWGRQQQKEMGLAQVEEGVGYALTRPGLMTFPLWWHFLHCAAIVLAHFGRHDTYTRLRATFNENTFRCTELPTIERYSPGAICPQLGGSCSKLAYWLQVRGTVSSLAEWKPQFGQTKLTEVGENAAYAAALNRKFTSSAADDATREHEVNADAGTEANEGNPAVMGGPDAGMSPTASKSMTMDGYSTEIVGGGLPERAPSSDLGLMRDSLDDGLQELGADLDGLAGGELNDFDLLGVEFDLSHLKELESETIEGSRDEPDFFNGIEASAQEGESISREISRIFAGEGALSNETSTASALQDNIQEAETLSHQ